MTLILSVQPTNSSFGYFQIYSYGDRAPRTKLGRVFAITWTLVGLIVTGIMVGNLASSLTVSVSHVEKIIYGTKVYVQVYIPYHTIPYHTIPYHTIPYHTIPYHTIPHHTTPHHTTPCIPYHAVQCRTMPYPTVPYRTYNKIFFLPMILY